MYQVIDILHNNCEGFIQKLDELENCGFQLFQVLETLSFSTDTTTTTTCIVKLSAKAEERVFSASRFGKYIHNYPDGVKQHKTEKREIKTKVNLNNIRIKMLQHYNSLVKTLNEGEVTDRKYIRLHIEEVENKLNDLRMDIVCCACCFDEDDPENFRSVIDEVEEVEFNPQKKG